MWGCAWGSIQEKHVSQCIKAIDQTPYYVVFRKETNKEYTQANDQVPERGNPTINETKGEEQTESYNERETNKPPDVDIPVEKDYTEAGEAKLKAKASTNETLQSRKRKGIN